MQNWTLRLFGLWHLKHERNGGVADCFRTESGELCNQVWDVGSDTASYLGPSCDWGSSIAARWRKDRLDEHPWHRKPAERMAAHLKTVCAVPMHGPPGTPKPSCFLGSFTSSCFSSWHISVIWHVVCLPFCLSGYCSGPSWVSEGTWMKEASHSSYRNSQLWLKPE